MVKCKFNCSGISEFVSSFTYSLSPVYGSEENKKYWEATPSGSLSLTIVKEKGKLFEVGKEYYIDITEAN